MRLLIFLLIVFSVHAHAKQYTFLAEIAPPFTYTNKDGTAGIYKDILDYAFKDSKHTYVLNLLNTRSLITAINNKEFDAIIGISTYAPYFSDFKSTIPIGSITLNPITAKNFNLPLPYTQALESKKVGAVYGVGFEQLLARYNLITYKYAQQGVVKLFENEVDVIIENPLIIKCTPDTILGLTPSNKTLYLHLPLVESLDIYIGLFESNQEIIDLINKATKTVNINTLKESYYQTCNVTSNLILNK